MDGGGPFISGINKIILGYTISDPCLHLISEIATGNYDTSKWLIETANIRKSDLRCLPALLNISYTSDRSDITKLLTDKFNLEC